MSNADKDPDQKQWSVALYWSSARPDQKVLCLSADPQEARLNETHVNGFIRRVYTNRSHLPEVVAYRLDYPADMGPGNPRFFGADDHHRMSHFAAPRVIVNPLCHQSVLQAAQAELEQQKEKTKRAVAIARAFLDSMSRAATGLADKQAGVLDVLSELEK